MSLRAEVITCGGEEQFAGDIIDESLVLQDKIHWYTSMLGRKTSVEFILAKLTKLGVSRIVVTEFKQGKTVTELVNLAPEFWIIVAL